MRTQFERICLEQQGQGHTEMPGDFLRRWLSPVWTALNTHGALLRHAVGLIVPWGK